MRVRAIDADSATPSTHRPAAVPPHNRTDRRTNERTSRVKSRGSCSASHSASSSRTASVRCVYALIRSVGPPVS